MNFATIGFVGFMGKKRGKSPILKSVIRTNSDSFANKFFLQFGKTGQITTFIIVSLVLALFVAVIFFVINAQFSLKEKAQQSVVSEFSLFPPEKFVTHCVQREIVDIARITLGQGGVYDLVSSENISNRALSATSFRALPYLYWSKLSGNQFITADFVANQINEQLPDALNDCINLSLYASQGYTVRSGSIATNTTISGDQVNVLVYYPITLEKGTTNIERTIFTVNVDLPIGNMLKDAREIVNSQIENDPVDTQVFMHQKDNNWLNNPKIIVDKNTVYPDTLYSLQLSYKEIELALRFAVQGVDVFLPTSTRSLYSQISDDVSSCISFNGACYSSVPYDLCVNNNGEYRQGVACNLPSNEIDDSVANSFDSCGFSDGTSVPSGSSWCATGDSGLSMMGVGSRHSRLLCVDGNVLQEPCQDYRLEVCAQSVQNNLLVAQCQPNAANVCGVCKDKNCCEALDCVYTAQQVCVPKVSLGIPFWKSDVQTCQEQFARGMDLASGRISSPTAQATLCAQYADCGATISVIGETTQSQFDNSDYYSRLSSFWQLQNVKYDEISKINSNIKKSSSALVNAAGNNKQSISSLLSNALSDVEQLATYDTTDYLNPDVQIDISTQTSSCQPYVAPQSPSCSFCSTFSKACSEYVCRSLGATCRAIQNVSSDSGVTCVDSSTFNGNPLRITGATNSQGTLLEPSTINSLNGFRVSQVLSARELLSVNLTTDRPARCKPTYLPYLSFTDVGSLDMSNGVYSTQHQLRIKFVNDLPVFDRVLTNFAVADYSKLVSALADFKLKLDQLRLRYGFIPKYNPTFYPYLNTVVSQYLSDRTRPTLLSLLDGISNKNFAVFFVCQDEYGNELSQSPFVQFRLESSCTPSAPNIISIAPDADPYVSKSVTLYLDKLGSCRYDSEPREYDSMRYNMSCALSEYDLSSVNDGSYACVADTTIFTPDVSNMYVSCSDSVTEKLTRQSLILNYDVASNATVAVNLSEYRGISLDDVENRTLTFSSQALIGTGFGYRCELSNPESIFSLLCKSDLCTVAKNGNNLSGPELITCKPRVPTNSCSNTQVHISAPQNIALVKLPSFVYEDAQVYGRDFIVSVKSRGTQISCTLTDEQGATYSLVEKTNQSSTSKTFFMSSSLLVDRSLVKITCQDGYGLAPQFVSLVKKE